VERSQSKIDRDLADVSLEDVVLKGDSEEETKNDWKAQHRLDNANEWTAVTFRTVAAQIKPEGLESILGLKYKNVLYDPYREKFLNKEEYRPNNPLFSYLRQRSCFIKFQHGFLDVGGKLIWEMGLYPDKKPSAPPISSGALLK
jgi:hypothetical protein